MENLENTESELKVAEKKVEKKRKVSSRKPKKADVNVEGNKVMVEFTEKSVKVGKQVAMNVHKAEKLARSGKVIIL